MQKREIAFKVSITEVLNSPYVKEEGWTPNYLSVAGKKVSRINLIATVVDKDESSAVIDDSTGSIMLRTFEDNKWLVKVNVGDCVLVIGRPREYNNEKYIIPEIVKSVSSKWGLVRKLELSKRKTIIESPVKKVEADLVGENVYESILSIIRNDDNDKGVDVDVVISKSRMKNADTIITSLIERGEIFKIGPGRVKILE